MSRKMPAVLPLSFILFNISLLIGYFLLVNICFADKDHILNTDSTDQSYFKQPTITYLNEAHYLKKGEASVDSTGFNLVGSDSSNLTVPPNAIKEKTRFTISELDTGWAVPPGYLEASPVYKIDPISFCSEIPMKLSLPIKIYSAKKIPNNFFEWFSDYPFQKSQIYYFHFEKNQWLPLDTYVDLDKFETTAEIQCAGFYRILIENIEDKSEDLENEISFQQKSKIWQAPAACPTGLAYGKGMLWSADTVKEIPSGYPDRLFAQDLTKGGLLSEKNQSSDTDQNSNNSENSETKAGNLQPLEVELNLPDPYPTGLAFDGEALWVADPELDQLIRINPEDASVIWTLKSPAHHPWGLTWDGNYLWNVDGHSHRIYQIEPHTGQIISSFPIQAEYPRGLAFDGKYLWLADDYKDLLICYDPVTGNEIFSMPSPGTSPQGLTYYNGLLFCADNFYDAIYIISNPNKSK